MCSATKDAGSMTLITVGGVHWWDLSLVHCRFGNPFGSICAELKRINLFTLQFNFWEFIPEMLECVCKHAYKSVFFVNRCIHFNKTLLYCGCIYTWWGFCVLGYGTLCQTMRWIYVHYLTSVEYYQCQFLTGDNMIQNSMLTQM